jgi:Ca-activated chloride channel family protein
MSSLPKLALLSLVVIAIGALQFAVPAFTSKHITPASSHLLETKIEQPDSALINQPINDYQHAQSGALYLIHELSKQGETIQQHMFNPTLKTEVDIEITGIIARTRLTQTF